ncbi:uncharacterized protein LOC105442032 isoform X2 [Strongylocentrotus purpuratus]|uniref:DUF7869 domain-containing protein n=1 Tax=Strongylocentrotus purpuratus TaxID=7668 RepID=A0A7M7P2M0_STRPU|nr:uncharacterized protein LOC105442032 isoform X2 [Strongylocentrotus purpuratus]
MEQTTELLVQWKKDGSKNVVVYGDIQCPCIPIKGTKVFMPWKGRRWEGVVLAVDDESEESDDDSIPLAQLIIKDRVPLPDQPRLDVGDVGVTMTVMPWKGNRWEGVVLAVDDESEESDDDSTPLAQLIIKDRVPLPDQPRLDVGDVGVTMTDRVPLPDQPRLDVGDVGVTMTDRVPLPDQPRLDVGDVGVTMTDRVPLPDQPRLDVGDVGVTMTDRVPLPDQPRLDVGDVGVTMTDVPHEVQMCEHFTCLHEVFSTCSQCLVFLCEHHFKEDDPCANHNNYAHLLQIPERLSEDHPVIDTVLELMMDVPLAIEVQETVDIVPERVASAYHTINAEVEPDLHRDIGERPEQCENKKARKRFADPNSWQQNVQRKNRNLGQAYTSRDGKQREVREMGPCCPNSCRFKCSESITADAREKIFKDYWATGSYEQQRDFIRQCGSEKKKGKKHGSKEKASRITRIYSLPIDGQRIEVCQFYFINTLAISQKTVRYTLAQKANFAQDKRGHHQPHNKTNEAELDCIRAHIQKFKVVPSHYCRSTTSRQYLPGNLSVNKMYDMYVKETVNPKSLTTYRYVFNSEFNLGFHAPKKDECKKCTAFDNASPNEKEGLKKDQDDHVHNKIKAREEKEKDKQRASKDDSFQSFTFDLQQVLSTPSCNASLLFYKRKLSTYNLTLYNQGNGDGHCFLWSEIDGGRGSCEIGSCLVNHLEGLPDCVDHVTLFSDCCSGQNRNKYVAAALLYVVRTSSLSVIEQKFLESGHTQMEVDSMHSAIETVKKKVPVYHPDQWATIASLARRNKPYHVTQLHHHEFVDLKRLASELLQNTVKDISGDRVYWTRIKHLKFEKQNPHVMQFRYSFEEEMREIRVSSSRKMSNLRLEVLHHDLLKISAVKKADLVSLCDQNVIPLAYQAFYRALPASDDEDLETFPEE